jgi:hypothetical protein
MMTDEDIIAEAKIAGIDPRLMALYKMLPAPPQAGAPVDSLLKLLGGGLGGIGMKSGQVVADKAGGLLDTIMAGLSGRREVSARESAHDQFGVPVESTYKTILDEATGKPKQVRIDPKAEFPPPGVDPTEWALANPRNELAPAQNDPNFVPGPAREYGAGVPTVTAEDIDRWEKVLSAPNETVVEKPKPAAKPKAATPAKPAAKPKPKPKAPKTGWDAVVTGLGPYGNR